eukprot:scaffold166200_cov16-Prasinocladus_malaysianus.AAC.1
MGVGDECALETEAKTVSIHIKECSDENIDIEIYVMILLDTRPDITRQTTARRKRTGGWRGWRQQLGQQLHHKPEIVQTNVASN